LPFDRDYPDWTAEKLRGFTGLPCTPSSRLLKKGIEPPCRALPCTHKGIVIPLTLYGVQRTTVLWWGSGGRSPEKIPIAFFSSLLGIEFLSDALNQIFHLQQGAVV
jgi:hypothetical protein